MRCEYRYRERDSEPKNYTFGNCHDMREIQYADHVACTTMVEADAARHKPIVQSISSVY